MMVDMDLGRVSKEKLPSTLLYALVGVKSSASSYIDPGSIDTERSDNGELRQMKILVTGASGSTSVRT